MKIITKLNKINKNIQNIFSYELLNTLDILYNISQEENFNIFLVGGIVRDIFLERDTKDIDIICSGNFLEIGNKICEKFNVKKFRINEKFLTYNIELENGINIDIATFRKEFYEKSGSLPKVEKSSIDLDFLRRDFTINSIYIKFDETFEIFDPLLGILDIKNKKIKILHAKSFYDDPTRIIRALKFLTRYNFNFETHTENLIREAVSKKYLLNISSDRFKNKIHNLLNEKNLENIFLILNNYNIFSVFNVKPLNFYEIKKIISDDFFNENINNKNFLLSLNLLKTSDKDFLNILKYFKLSKKNMKFLVTSYYFFNSLIDI